MASLIRTNRLQRLTVAASNRKLAIAAGALAVSGLTTFAFNAVMAATLPTAEYGDLARTFYLGMAIAQLTMASFAPTIARIVAQREPESERLATARGAVPRLIGTAAALSLLYPLAAYAGAAPTNDAVLLASGIGLAFVYAVYFGLKLILFALDRVGLYGKLELLAGAVFFPALAVFAVSKPSAAVIAFVAAYGVFAFVLASFLRASTSRRSSIALTVREFSYAGWSLLGTYASVARLPIVVAVAGASATPAEAAKVALAFALATPLMLPAQASGFLAFPAGARATHLDRGQIREVSSVVAYVSAGAILFAAWWAQEAVALVGGQDYASVGRALEVLVLSLVFLAVGIPAANALAGQGRVGANAAVSAVAMAVALGGSLLLLAPYGASGALYAVAASNVFIGVAVIALVRRSLPGVERGLATPLMGAVMVGGAFVAWPHVALWAALGAALALAGGLFVRRRIA